MRSKNFSLIGPALFGTRPHNHAQMIYVQSVIILTNTQYVAYTIETHRKYMGNKRNEKLSEHIYR